MKKYNTANIETQQLCAFCKYWNDPANSTIKPCSSMSNIWQYNQKGKMICLKKKSKTRAAECCENYSCKLLIV